jgi:hypothetical protein
VCDDIAIAHGGESRLASLGSCVPTLDLRQSFLSAGLLVAGVVVGLASPLGLTGVIGAALGFAAPVSAGGSSELQPATKTIARTRLESIVQVLIPDLKITDALLEEKHKTRQGIPISLPQLTHASGP